MQRIQTLDILYKKIIAIMLMAFILVTPIAYSQSTSTVDRTYGDSYYAYGSAVNYGSSSANYAPYSSYGNYDYGNYDLWGDSYSGQEEDLGEAIVVNIVDMEPPVPLKSRLIEKSNVPVYAYLGGSTLGSLPLGIEGGSVLSNPKIKYAVVTLDQESQKYVNGVPYYVRPTRLDSGVDNLGYLVFLLKKIPNEKDVPEEIVLNLSMKIYFDLTQGFGDVSATDLSLKEYSDEDKWRSEIDGSAINSFWNKKGYLRLINSVGSTATIQVYGTGMSPTMLNEPSSTGAYTTSNRFLERGIITLTEGESKIINLPGTSLFFKDQVRIKLNKIQDAGNSAHIRIKVGDTEVVRILSEGSRLFPGSDWRIAQNGIYKSDSGDRVVYTVVLENMYGDTKTLETSSLASADSVNAVELNADNVGMAESTVCPDEFVIDNVNQEKEIIQGILQSSGSVEDLTEEEKQKSEQSQQQYAQGSAIANPNVVEQSNVQNNNGFISFDSTKTSSSSSCSGNSCSADAVLDVKSLTGNSIEDITGMATLSMNEIVNYARQGGFMGEEIPIAAAIAMAESGGNPNIVNNKGEESYGLWQINMNDDGPKRRVLFGIKSNEELKDPLTNAKAAYYLYSHRGNWNDWTMYKNGVYNRYLSSAQKAAQTDSTLECADSIDNDKDGKIDRDDPDCHWDGKDINENSYEPTNSEYPLTQNTQQSSSTPTKSEIKVVLYTNPNIPNCPACLAAKNYFAKKGITPIIKDKTEGTVPVIEITINGKTTIINVWDGETTEKQIDALLATANTQPSQTPSNTKTDTKTQTKSVLTPTETLYEEVDLYTRPARVLYCTALKEYKRALYSGKDYEVYGKMAKAYEDLASYYVAPGNGINLDKRSFEIKKNILGLAAYYYRLAGNDEKAQDAVQKSISGSESTSLWLSEEGIQLQLVKVDMEKESGSSAKLKIDNQERKVIREELLFPEQAQGTVQQVANVVWTYNWYVQSIRDNYVTLVKKNPNNEIVEHRVVNKGVPTVIGRHNVLLQEAVSNVRAFVTVYPGGGNAFSTSSFKVHIPIDKRAIKFSTDQIKDLIDKNEKFIENLDSNINALDKLIKTWSKVCLATWALLMVKNSFSGGAVERNAARKDVMPMYSEYCESEHGPGRQYPTYDDCMNALSSEIESNLNTAQKAIAGQKECINAKTYAEKVKKCSAEGFTGIEELDQLKQNAGLEPGISDQTFGDYYKYCVKYKDLKFNDKIKDQFESKVAGECLKATKEINDEVKSKDTALKAIDNENNMINGKPYSYYLKNKEALNALSREDRQKVLSEYNYLKSLAAESSRPSRSSDIEAVKAKVKKYFNQEVTVLERVSSRGIDPKTGKQQYIGYEKVGEELVPVVLHIPTWNEASNPTLIDEKCKDTTKPEECKRILGEQEMTFEDGIHVYMYDAGKLYVALDEFTSSETGERKDFAKDATLEVDDQGRPYCIPKENGDFYWIQGGDNAWNKLGEPIGGSVSLMNVGPDGKMCTADDVMIMDPVTLEKNSREMSNVKRSPALKIRCKNGEKGVIRTAGKSWDCSDGSYKKDKSYQTTHCQDIMDPSDCRTLFLVCDPIMCPASRFNFGGAYPTFEDDSIVQKGILGSLILGQKNFNKPVCLPGILSGLKNLRSVSQSFIECLNAQLVGGENVGICDTIRSLSVCEIIWREVIVLFKLQGGVYNIINKFLYGDNNEKTSGGEYVGDLNKKLEAAMSNWNYFTQNYATSSFQSFKGKSTEEVGGEICKAAIYNKAANIDEFVTQIAEPENPPQATGWFSESPWSVKGGISYDQYGRARYSEQSEYTVYYHIYAGSIPEYMQQGFYQQGVRYAVYLTNRDGTQRISVTSEDTNAFYSSIPYEQSVDKTVVTYGPPNLEKICIWMSGQEFCGIGKASTLYAVTAVNDLFVNDEASRTDIATMEDCVPEYSRTNPGLGSVKLPRSYGTLNTGIIRLCSVRDPNENEQSNKNRWRVVGTCGQDSQGHNLGYCWLDTSSIGIENVYMKEDLMKKLDVNEDKITNELRAVDQLKMNFYNAEASKQFFQELEAIYNGGTVDTGTLINLLSGSVRTVQDEQGNVMNLNYRELSIYSQDPDVKVNSQIRVGDIYTKLASTIPQRNFQVFVGTRTTVNVPAETSSTPSSTSTPGLVDKAREVVNKVIDAVTPDKTAETQEGGCPNINDGKGYDWTGKILPIYKNKLSLGYLNVVPDVNDHPNIRVCDINDNDKIDCYLNKDEKQCKNCPIDCTKLKSQNICNSCKHCLFARGDKYKEVSKAGNVLVLISELTTDDNLVETWDKIKKIISSTTDLVYDVTKDETVGICANLYDPTQTTEVKETGGNVFQILDGKDNLYYIYSSENGWLISKDRNFVYKPINKVLVLSDINKDFVTLFGDGSISYEEGLIYLMFRTSKAEIIPGLIKSYTGEKTSNVVKNYMDWYNKYKSYLSSEELISSTADGKNKRERDDKVYYLEPLKSDTKKYGINYFYEESKWRFLILSLKSPTERSTATYYTVDYGIGLNDEEFKTFLLKFNDEDKKLLNTLKSSDFVSGVKAFFSKTWVNSPLTPTQVKQLEDLDKVIQPPAVPEKQTSTEPKPDYYNDYTYYYFRHTNTQGITLKDLKNLDSGMIEYDKTNTDNCIRILFKTDIVSGYRSMIIQNDVGVSEASKKILSSLFYNSADCESNQNSLLPKT